MSDVDVVVIGGGHNGLVAAALLARSGRRVTLVERRRKLGGAATTDEFHPGFRVSSVAHTSGPIHPAVAREVGIDRAVDWIHADPLLTVLNPDGTPLCISADTNRTVESFRGFSGRDAQRWPEFEKAVGRLCAVLEKASFTAPPDVTAIHWRELLPLAGLGLAFRRLGRHDGQNALRWLPMAVADFAQEWFETPLLQAAVAARGITGVAAGPWSAGTTANLLLRAAWAGGRPLGSTTFARGGLGSLADALVGAATRAGVRVRTDAGVRCIQVKDDRATGVVLESGDEIHASAVVSAADPKHTMLDLVDPAVLDPEERHRVHCLRAAGMASKVHLALRDLPRFRGVDASLLRGRVQIGPEIDYLERAFDAWKYGADSEGPSIELTIPTLVDASLAPAGRHVLSAYVQFTPRTLRAPQSDRRDAIARRVLGTLESYAPGLQGLVEHVEVLAPEDLETRYGLTGGHPDHGEHALDQLFTMRPLWGWPPYRTPIRGLFLCSAGTHPGGGVTGLPGRNAARVIAKVFPSLKQDATGSG